MEKAEDDEDEDGGCGDGGCGGGKSRSDIFTKICLLSPSMISPKVINS
jgi:hypothetical protein